MTNGRTTLDCVQYLRDRRRKNLLARLPDRLASVGLGLSTRTVRLATSSRHHHTTISNSNKNASVDDISHSVGSIEVILISNHGKRI
jgi:hypothetical protein